MKALSETIALDTLMLCQTFTDTILRNNITIFGLARPKIVISFGSNYEEKTLLYEILSRAIGAPVYVYWDSKVYTTLLILTPLNNFTPR